MHLSKIFTIFIVSFLFLSFKPDDRNNQNDNPLVVRTQIEFNQNNISTWIQNSGTFNLDIRTNNMPGFEWPKGSGKFALFTTGLTLAANVNGSLRMAAGSYTGEWVPGYIENNLFVTNSSFKLYRVKRGDSQSSNPDWANWGLMVPYGAPYTDVNSSGTYEPAIDTPGVKNANETIFLCMTDADPSSHISSEGFGGGTQPMYAEAHMTAWSYSNPGYQDIQFLKWEVINKNNVAWNNTYFSIVADPDLGDPLDDYIGCDTTRNLGYCYNADNMDGTGSGNTYGANPPAVGISYLNCNLNSAKMNSFIFFTNTGSGGPVCENDPSTPQEAYNFMKGKKRDNTSFINPQTNQPSNYCYSGNPETSQGWTEYTGAIQNCNGATTGTLVSPVPPGDRRFVMNYGPDNFTVSPGDTQTIIIAQLIARGSSNLNSVSLLKTLTDRAIELCQNNFVVGIRQTSTEVPESFDLKQNYPNPFNPSTVISYSLPSAQFIELKVYDVLGNEVSTLVNERQTAGTYSVDWSGSNFPSGVYYYTLKSGTLSQTRKMLLIK